MSAPIDQDSPGLQIEQLLRISYPSILTRFWPRPGLVAFLYTILFLGSGVFGALIFGGFSNTTDVIDLVDDWAYLYGVIITGAIIYYYLAIPSQLGKTFDKLYRHRIFSGKIVKIPLQATQVASSRWLKIFPLAGTLIIAFFWITTASLSQSTLWWENNLISFITMIIIWAGIWYAFVGLLINVFFSIFLISTVFYNNEIIVQRFHPDKCGGLKPLSEFSSWINSLALIYGILLIIWTISAARGGPIITEYGLLLQLGAYFIVVPVLFYLPLHSPHTAMVVFRDKLIGHTADCYLELHQSLHSDQEPLKVKTLKDKVDCMTALENLHNHEVEYPIWPFDQRTRLRVVVKAALPLLPTILGFVLDLLS